MPFVVLLTDRDPSDALPALADLRVDLKTDPLASPSIEHVAGLSPDVVIVDASENPGQGFAICRELGSRPLRAPTIALVERDQLARFPWEEVAEDFLYPGAPENEIDTRLRMLVRRHGRAQAHVIRL